MALTRVDNDAVTHVKVNQISDMNLASFVAKYAVEDKAERAAEEEDSRGVGNTLQHKKVLCWWSTIRHILLWSFFCCTPFLLMLLFPTTTEGGWEHGASTGVSVLASRWTGVSN